jgi:hypothetical protein
MKIGDLVKDVFCRSTKEKIGTILREVWNPMCGVTPSNKSFDILWQDGTIGHNVWIHDLKVIVK